MGNPTAPQENIYFGAYWRDRRLTARQYIQLCHEFLSKLYEFSPAFAPRCVVLGRDPVILPTDYESFERIMAQSINDPNYVYENPDSAARSFTLNATLSQGFRAAISDPDPLATRQTAISISVAAGAYAGGKSYKPTNVVLIEIPAAHRDVWADRAKALMLLQIVVDTWRPAFAVLTSTELKKALNPTRMPNDFSVGTLTYFEDALVARAVTGITSVADFGERGALISIDAPEPWSAHVDLFSPVYDKLSAANLLKWREARSA